MQLVPSKLGYIPSGHYLHNLSLGLSVYSLSKFLKNPGLHLQNWPVSSATKLTSRYCFCNPSEQDLQV